LLSFTFLRSHFPLLAFGWLMAFCSGFGQTYFISIFGGAIRADFGLDHTVYGSCYSAGTLTSAFVLLWAGRLIDRWSLMLFSLAAVGGLALAAGVMSVSQGALGLAVAFFMLRFFGQGLMSHAAMTTMGRYFSAERGRAVSFALTGHVAGGAVLPLLGVALMSFLAWRQVWLAGGLMLAAVAVPVVAFILSKAGQAHGPTPGTATMAVASSGVTRQPRDWTLGDVLGDRGVYVRLAVLLAPAFITTGLIFHQVHLGAQKGWTLPMIATALSVYALGSFVMTLATGRMVDRFGARQILPFGLVPLAVGCLMLPFLGSAIGALVFFGLMGLGSGVTSVLMGAIWAELYGTAHLGAIRAFAAAGSVFSSGLAPGIVGILMDLGWHMDAIGLACAIYCVAASILAGLMMDAPERTKAGGG
jgi:MFS family permease